MTIQKIMAEFTFIPDAGTKIKEIEPSGTHTAAQSKEKGETDAQIQNSAAAARLEEILRDFNLKVSDLELEVVKDCVRLSGKVEDQETKEKAILAVGNIQGIAKVEEDLSVRKSAAESGFHTVERADSLEIIAEKVLKDAGRSSEILAANTPLLKSAKEIYPGMVLRIPSQQE